MTKTVLPENPIMLRPQSPRGLIYVPYPCFGVVEWAKFGEVEWEKLQSKILLMKSDDKMMNVFYEVQFLNIDIRSCFYYSLATEVSVTRRSVRCVGDRQSERLTTQYCMYRKAFCSPLELQESCNIANVLSDGFRQFTMEII